MKISQNILKIVVGKQIDISVKTKSFMFLRLIFFQL